MTNFTTQVWEDRDEWDKPRMLACCQGDAMAERDELKQEVERLRSACEAEFRSVEVLNEANQKLQAQLAEAQGLLHKIKPRIAMLDGHDWFKHRDALFVGVKPSKKEAPI